MVLSQEIVRHLESSVKLKKPQQTKQNQKTKTQPQTPTFSDFCACVYDRLYTHTHARARIYGYMQTPFPPICYKCVYTYTHNPNLPKHIIIF